MSTEPSRTDKAPVSGGLRERGLSPKGSVDKPLVSVITAVFNGEQYLASCMESVLLQDYPHVEHIIIDGGSTDATLAILRSYNDKISYWKSQPDKGVYDAWNKGLEIAQGEWICFVGVDDELLPGAISAYMELARRHPESEYLSSRERWVHPSGYERIRGGPWSWNRFLRSMCVAHVGSMHRRSLYERLGNYDLSFGSAADYELLLRARQTLRAAYMPTLTVMMRGGGMTDAPSAFADATRAKIRSGGRSFPLAQIELALARVKAVARPLRYFLGKKYANANPATRR